MIKLLKYAKKYIFYTLLSPLLMVGEVIFELLIPQVMANIVETIRLTGTTDPVAQQEAIQTILALGGKMLTFAKETKNLGINKFLTNYFLFFLHLIENEQKR